jgi:hypothetical protein
MRIANIDAMGEIAASLLRDAAAEVRPLYAQTPPGPMLGPTNDPPRGRDLYVAAFLGDSPVGCGTLREFDRTSARRLGYERLILETTNRQAPAIAFCENHGFKRIEPFGEHVNDPTSLCYEMHIDSARAGPATV